MQGGVIRDPDIDSLHVVGSGLEEALWSTSLRPVSVADVEARLAVADPGLFQTYQVKYCYYIS